MNQKEEIIKIKDLPQELLDEVVTKIKPYIVGLLGVNDKNSKEHAQLLGSGTLVKLENSYGILTAKHLTDHLHKFNKLGINLGTFEHKLAIDTKVLHIVDINKTIENSTGPDISLIIFPEINTGTIKAIKSFWNIPFYKDRILTKPIEKDLGLRLWVVCGFPGKLVEQAKLGGRFDKTLICCCLCGFTGAEEYWIEGEFDYLKLSVLYKNRIDLPMTFRGVSGGGIWRVVLSRSNSKEIYTQNDPVFLGVAILETNIQNDSRSIIGHGWRTIYEQLPNYI